MLSEYMSKLPSSDANPFSGHQDFLDSAYQRIRELQIHNGQTNYIFDDGAYKKNKGAIGGLITKNNSILIC